jgi:hypothetical protein
VVEHDGERVSVYTRTPMAIEVDVEMLQLGDVILIDLPDQGTNIEAQVVGESPEVVREIERSESTVRARLRVSGRDDFVMEWPLDTRVILIRGP